MTPEPQQPIQLIFSLSRNESDLLRFFQHTLRLMDDLLSE